MGSQTVCSCGVTDCLSLWGHRLSVAVGSQTVAVESQTVCHCGVTDFCSCEVTDCLSLWGHRLSVAVGSQTLSVAVGP